MTTSSLSHLTDLALHQDFLQIAQSEREILSQVLLHIREVDRRKLFAALGFTSLFDYLTRGLKYSEGSAQRSLIQTQAKAASPPKDEHMMTEIKGKSFRESEKIIQSQTQTEKLPAKRKI
jgi:5-methylcytosine-specific restriction endonuclease McrA